MNTSIYLGRFFGLYLLLTGIAIIVRGNSFRTVMHEIIKSPALVTVSGIFTLILGLFLVLAHNMWEWSWRLVVTLLSYITLIKGITLLYVPEWVNGMAHHLDRVQWFRVIGLITAIVGIFLIICTY